VPAILHRPAAPVTAQLPRPPQQPQLAVLARRHSQLPKLAAASSTATTVWLCLCGSTPKTTMEPVSSR
jgi:hypothetical protein